MKIIRLIDVYLERTILAAVLFALVAILAAQVFFRYVLGAPLVWSEELARYLLVWSTFIGVSLAVREGRNISVDLLPVFLGEAWWKFFSVLALLGSALFFALMIVFSVPITQKIAMIGQVSPGLDIQMWLVYLAVPVGMSMALLRSIQALYLLWRDGILPGNPQPDEHPVIRENV